jgi:glycogen(starch) synthase
MPSAYAPAVGGVEVLTARLAHHLLLRGHAVEVWAPRSEGDDLPVREVIDGIVVRRFVFAMPRTSVGAVLRTPRAAVRTLRALRAAVEEFGPTHLHVQCFSGNCDYATALSRLTRTPLVVTLQGETVMDDHDIYDHSMVLRAALRWGLRHASQVTGCSQFTLDDARHRFGLKPAKSSVIFNGVDLDEVEPTPVELPFRRYVLGLGRVVHKKGFDLLIDAFASIADRHPDVGLVIAGTGAELITLQAQADLLGLSERLHFPGRLDRRQVAAVMAGAEVFVMPSRVEPFGIVALEAWRAGVPVVVTDRGGASEFVLAGERGLVAAPGEGSSLATALSKVLSEPELGPQLVEQATQALPQFTWNVITSEYEERYRELVDA